MMAALLQSLLCSLLLLHSSAFQPPDTQHRSNLSQLGLFNRWGGGSSTSNSNNEDSGVDQVMDSMQSFKTNQRLGSLTSGMLQELASVTVEGRSEDGKVRVVMNGQQYPIACQVSDDADMITINSAMTEAMQDAHAKSLATMEAKMKSLYEDLGLPSSPTKK
jgi:DNA-binding protein YbaB